jgi:hypothetical protein
MATRLPASERTREELRDLIKGRLASSDERSALRRLAPRLIVEEALEAEVEDALGRGYDEHAELALARGDGRLPRLMRTLDRVRLLILDDWELKPLTAEQRHDLLEIVDDRCDRGAMIITRQVPVDRWHDVVGDPTLADAILDRIVHNAYRLRAHRRQPAQTQQARGCHMNTPITVPPERSPRWAHRHLPRALLRQPYGETLHGSQGLLWTTGTTAAALDLPGPQ